MDTSLDPAVTTTVGSFRVLAPADLALANIIADEWWRRHKAGPVTQCDFRSAANYGLALAWSRYRGDRGAKFHTFARYHIRGAILDYLRSIDTVSRWARDHGDNSQSGLTQLAESGRADPQFPKLEVTADIERLLSHISPIARRVIELTELEGLSRREAAGVLGIKKESVSNCRYRAMGYLRTAARAAK